MSKALVLQLSDTHVGKKSKSYTYHVARQRLESLAGKLPGRVVDEVVVIMNGDMIDGSRVFPSQAAKNQLPVIKQLAVARQAIQNLLVAIHKKYNCPVRLHGVPGNHGMAAFRTHPMTNWDNVLLAELGQWAKTTDFLSVKVCYDEFQTVRVAGTKGLVTHIGVPYLDTKPRRADFLTWITHFKADWMAVGHWHHPAMHTWAGKHLFVGGALPGIDDYGMRKALIDPPAQCCWLVTGRECHDHTVIKW